MEIIVKVPSGSDRVRVLGPAERTLKLLREALGVNVAARDGRVHVTGDRGPVLVARNVLENLAGAAMRGEEMPSRQRVLDLISGEADAVGEGDESGGGHGSWDGSLHVYAAGRPVRAKTPNQQAYLEAIRDHDLVFAIGPAGTGKTYLAVAAAVHLLKTGRAKRVILARPAVEAGEKLGYLPGDLRAKVNPYLRPLFDALADMIDYSTLRRFMENDVVEVSPLAFMRGRTLNNAVIILDEAQNTTRGQMQMFLTRLGHGSRMIVTGDATQVDLPDPGESGLVDAARRLARTPGVGFVTFGRADVVRHALVQRIIDAYGGDSPARPGRRSASSRVERSADNPEADDGLRPMDDRTLTEPDPTGAGPTRVGEPGIA